MFLAYSSTTRYLLGDIVRNQSLDSLLAAIEKMFLLSMITDHGLHLNFVENIL